MEFVVALLAEVMEIQGLATHAEICDMMRTAATGPTPAAAVAKALSSISHLVDDLEERERPRNGGRCFRCFTS